jgi:hypothetical protein
MEEKYTSVALWGSGETDIRAATALLNDYLPEKIGSVLRPETVGRGSLRSVVNWLEGDDQLGENGTVGTPDVVSSLLELEDSEGDDIVLITLWPVSPSREDILLADSAVASGIPVLDLCAALDELIITDDMREAANPAPEKPKRETKKAREEREAAERELAEAKAKEALELEIARAAEIARNMESRGQETVTQTEALDINGMPELDPWVEVGVPLDAIRKIVREELQRIFSDYGFEKPRVHVGSEPWIESQAVAAAFDKGVTEAKPKRGKLSAMTEEVPVTHAKEPLPEDDGTVPFRGPYTDGKLGYYMSEDGFYRRSNGKPRRGEVEVFLTAEEIDTIRNAGIL